MDWKAARCDVSSAHAAPYCVQFCLRKEDAGSWYWRRWRWWWRRVKRAMEACGAVLIIARIQRINVLHYRFIDSLKILSGKPYLLCAEPRQKLGLRLVLVGTCLPTWCTLLLRMYNINRICNCQMVLLKLSQTWNCHCISDKLYYTLTRHIYLLKTVWHSDSGLGVYKWNKYKIWMTIL